MSIWDWDDEDRARSARQQKEYDERQQRWAEAARYREEENSRQKEADRRRNNAQNGSSSGDYSGIGWLIVLGIAGYIIYKVIQFIEAHWVSIVTILGIIVACVIACIVINKKAKSPGLIKLITILTAIGLIGGTLYLGTAQMTALYSDSSANIGAMVNKLPQTISSQGKSSAVYGYVKSDALNMRAKASGDSEIVARLLKDDRLEVIDGSGHWWKVRFGNIEGYVVSEYLRYEKNKESIE